MISGFFLIEKSTWRWKGILNTWIETFFYSNIFLLASFLIGRQVFFSDVAHSLFPIWGRQYWFMTYYIGLMLLAPLISKAVCNLNVQQYRSILLVLFVMNFQYAYGRQYGGFSSLMWFSFLFLSGGYIRLFGCPKWIKIHKGVIFFLIWSLLTIMALVFNLMKGSQAKLVSTAYHGPVYFLSLSLFIYFAMTPLKGKMVDVICRIAPYTLAVYLIHANSFWRGGIWKTVIPDSFNAPIILYCLSTSILIFLVCVLIDVVRSWLFIQLKIDILVERIKMKLPIIK